MSFDHALALYAAIYSTLAAPFFAWLFGHVAGRRRARARRRGLIGRLTGLPDELKAVLVDFHMQGAHTLRGDPSAPAIRQLRLMKLVLVGEGGGTYDAVDAYLTVAGEVWDVIGEWVERDPAVARIARGLEAAEDVQRG